ncbi:acyl-CoA dehydrogenase [Streptomyces sp. NPDC006482]|uniref:acyl-CoA dehydrogenase family protein n=1 Tax=Streptomyces sp. NPDC006482 TaxID=3154306 RepID=UPI0033A9CCCC
MIEFDRRLREIRGTAAEAGADLRERALAVDADPHSMEQHFDSPGFHLIRTITTPVEHRPSADRGTAGFTPGRKSLETAVSVVELARGDAAMLLACPGPGLAGVIVDLLGDDAQRERFYGRLADGRTWSFFAMTEAERGNDATAMETRVDSRDDGFLLTGRKRYIGNAARGGIGVVFARTGRSPMSIRALLVEPEAGTGAAGGTGTGTGTGTGAGAAGWHRTPLEMVGLRGAYLSEIAMENVPVAEDAFLGNHLPVTRRGIWGAVKTFNEMRVQIAALAVGTSLAMAEYVRDHSAGTSQPAGLDLVLARAEAARHLVYDAAACVDRDPERSYPSSVAKLAANQLAMDTARWSARALGPAGHLTHPLLEKWARDVCGFEFMEGTANIQRLHVEKGYRTGDADA